MHEFICLKILRIQVRFDHREEFVYSDGGTVHLDWKWAGGSATDKMEGGLSIPNEDNRPIVLLIPGSGNDSDEIYMQN